MLRVVKGKEDWLFITSEEMKVPAQHFHLIKGYKDVV